MFKKVFLLLLTWPLLLPPGFCLCRLDMFGVRTPGAAEVQATAPSQAAPSRPRCPCCRHKSAPPVDRACETCLREGTSSDPTQSLPHSPSCPAHPSWVIARAVVPGPVFTLDAGNLLALWVALDPPSLTFQPHPSRSRGLDERPSSTVPLYLTCCDLRC